MKWIIFISLLAWVSAAPSTSPTRVITPPINDTIASLNFGYSMALATPTQLILGSVGDVLERVWLFDRDVSGRDTWTFTGSIDPPPGHNAGERFGFDIDATETVLIVGAESADSGSVAESGAAYLYTRDNVDSDWEFLMRMEPTEPSFNGQYGRNVEICGEYFVVTASFETFNGVAQKGVVYAYDFQGTLLRRFSFPELSSSALGVGVVCDGDTFVSHINTEGIVFDRNSGGLNGFEEVTRLFPIPAPNTSFVSPFAFNGPSSMALQGDELLIAAPRSEVFDHADTVDRGVVYQYRRNSTGHWNDGQVIPAPIVTNADASAGAQSGFFGTGIAIRGNKLIIGAPRITFFGLDRGAVLTYTRNSTADPWVLSPQVFTGVSLPIEFPGATAPTITMATFGEKLLLMEDGGFMSPARGTSFFLSPVPNVPNVGVLTVYYPDCGDGTLTIDEGCDDGSFVPSDGCSDTCALEACGDGLINNNGVEECDDGNTVSGDGCDDDCTERFFCGDGIVDVDGALTGLVEECDDGNDVFRDGCTPECEVVLNACVAEECPLAPRQACSGFENGQCECGPSFFGETCSYHSSAALSGAMVVVSVAISGYAGVFASKRAVSSRGTSRDGATHVAKIDKTFINRVARIPLLVEFVQMLTFTFTPEVPWEGYGTDGLALTLPFTQFYGPVFDVLPFESVLFAVVAVCVVFLIFAACFAIPVREAQKNTNVDASKTPESSSATPMTKTTKAGKVPFANGEFVKNNPILRRVCLLNAVFIPAIAGPLFIPVARVLFSALDCTYPTAAGVPTLDTDPTITCWEGSHRTLALIGGLTVAAVIPMSILLLPRVQKLKQGAGLQVLWAPRYLRLVILGNTVLCVTSVFFTNYPLALSVATLLVTLQLSISSWFWTNGAGSRPSLSFIRGASFFIAAWAAACGALLNLPTPLVLFGLELRGVIVSQVWWLGVGVLIVLFTLYYYSRYGSSPIALDRQEVIASPTPEMKDMEDWMSEARDQVESFSRDKAGSAEREAALRKLDVLEPVNDQIIALVMRVGYAKAELAEVVKRFSESSHQHTTVENRLNALKEQIAVLHAQAKAVMDIGDEEN